MIKIIKSFLLIFFCFGFVNQVFSEDKYWIYFTDKGYSSSSNLGKIACEHLSERSIKRRIIRGDKNNIFDETDLPVYQPYIDQIRELGIKINHKSKWLNAVSAFADSYQIDAAEKLYFVKNSTPVKTFIRKKDDVPESSFKKSQVDASYSTSYNFNYGLSLTQVEMINVPKLHDEGYSGKGVLITLLDSGFNFRLHEAFKHLNVLVERDFVFRDNITRNELDDSLQVPPKGIVEQHDHGTQVLSIIGGFLQGVIIGPAFGATYALAKTEYVPAETRLEEDNWVAGLEWADSLGTDIVSSSIGYINFNDGFIYSYDELDGLTMPTSKAASIAVTKGIVVVAAAGNEANSPETPNWDYIISPADGRGVIAVGAVTSQGIRAYFSSKGPTFDGRIKPDVMAMGSGNITVNPNSETGIAYSRGTSFSAPLIAGVCALLLENHPNWTPNDVWKALTTTSTKALNPDNEYGYGIVNSWEAAQYEIEIPSSVKIIKETGINTLLGYSRFYIDLPEQVEADIKIFNSIGQKVDSFQIQIPPGKRRNILWLWPNTLSNGIYFAQIKCNQTVNLLKTVVIR